MGIWSVVLAPLMNALRKVEMFSFIIINIKLYSERVSVNLEPGTLK